MKRIVTLLPFALLFSAQPVIAQDAPPTGIGYIPGMPVPQAAKAAPSDTPSSSGNAKSGQGGQISRVSVASSARDTDKSAQKTAAAQKSPNTSEKSLSSVPSANASSIGTDDYKGVTPSKRDTPENSSTFTHKPGNQLSWIGFMPENNVHKIFVQTLSPTSFERIATSASRVEVRIFNAKLSVSNNERELDMKYFKTPFERAKAVPEGKNVRLIVDLKQETPCEVVQKGNFIEVMAKPSE